MFLYKRNKKILAFFLHFRLPYFATLFIKEERKALNPNNTSSRLSLNIDTTNFIIFKSPKHSSTDIMNIKIGNLPVKKTCYVKFLGVLVDQNLSWKYHLTELSKKLARTCGLFFKDPFYLLIF